MKYYKEIDFMPGSTVEKAVKELFSYKEKGVLVKGSFNGNMLYSDTVTMDSAYIDVTGKTKDQHDYDTKKASEEYDRNQKEHKEKIPELTKEWIEKGSKIIDEKYMDYWKKCVPIRLGDLYQGMELKCCLDIIEKLNGSNSFEDAKKELMEQRHSGMSFGLVCSMVESFCDSGKEFVKFVR